jgi:MFS transporter, DHA3 family, macrolide efflux protein
MDSQTGSEPGTARDEGGWKKKIALFLTSQSLSLFGSMLVQYAIIWHITLVTKSGPILTISVLTSFLPQILISLFAGVWADRYPRKLLIIGADAMIAISTLILAGFFLMGYEQLWLLFVVSAIRSLGAGIQGPAVNALIPQIVPEDRLMRVNSINSTLQPVIMLVSPMAAGALLAYARLVDIFFVDVVTAVLAIGLLIVLKVPAHRSPVAAQMGYLDDLKEGWAYLRQHQALKTLFIFFGFIHFLVVPVAFLTPLLVARSFGEEVWRLTANEVTFFVGSILGGIVMTAWGGFENRFRTIGLTCIVWAVFFSGLGLSSNFIVYLVFMFLSGIPMPFMSATSTTLMQEIVKPEMYGRVFGVQMLLVNSIMPVGMLFFGPLAEVVSIEVLLVAASSLMAVPGLWLFMRKNPFPAAVLPAPDYELQAGD